MFNHFKTLSNYCKADYLKQPCLVSAVYTANNPRRHTGNHGLDWKQQTDVLSVVNCKRKRELGTKRARAASEQSNADIILP